MRNFDFNAMQAHCDELTKDGKELSVNWDGGGDSGWYTLMLDDQEILSLSSLEDDILEYIAWQLGYGSFAGAFSTEGSAIYDREAKCFTGTDYYSESDEAVLECSIEIDIPEGIWFDRLIIETESNGGHDYLHTQISLQIVNGPYPEDFNEISVDVARQTNEKLMQALEHIENFAGVWDTFTIPRKEFEARDGVLRGRIKNLNYSFNLNEAKDICITFTK
jgi:hypothetical protein